MTEPEQRITGFTGSRKNPSHLQAYWLGRQFDWTSRLRHGACVGSDLLSHTIAMKYGLPTSVHPPVDQRLVAVECLKRGIPGVEVLLPQPYHTRNRAIVNGSDELVALPDGPQRAHSGTWYTILFALGKVDQHLLRRPIPVDICYPDGTVDRRVSS